MKAPTNHRELRYFLKQHLPREAFAPVPSDGYFLFPLVGFIVTVSWITCVLPLEQWPLKLLGGVLLGIAYGSLFFLGHETLHGSTFQSTWAQNVVGYAAFGIFCMTPIQWRHWHNVTHHGQTNIPGRDPDCYDLDDELRDTWAAKVYFWLSPGSGTLASYLYLFHFFTMQCHLVLWVQSKFRLPGVVGGPRSRRRAKIESLLIASGWVTLSVWMGTHALFVVLVPMMLANYSVMSFVATNHFLRPLVDENDPLANSMSVRTWKPYDVLNFFFSHHVEHHLFPSMNWRYRPLVRTLLQTYVPDRYICPTQMEALRWLYRTPRRYKDHGTLVCPYTGRVVEIAKLDAQLRGAALSTRSKPAIR